MPNVEQQLKTRYVAGRPVSPIALGSTPFGFADSTRDRASVEALHSAFDAGIDVVDTAFCYTTLDEPQHAERVVAEAVRTWPREVLVATKGGHWRSGPSEFPVDGRPETLRRHCELSLKALASDTIWLYYLHWPDPAVPIEESAGALADLQHEGKIEHIGLSNVDVDQLACAQSVATIAAVQNPYSLLTRGDEGALAACSDQGIAFFAYAALGGPGSAKTLGDQVPAAAGVAAARGVSSQQVALAWLIARSPAMIPLVGASSPATIRDSVAATQLQLSEEELTALTADDAGSR